MAARPHSRGSAARERFVQALAALAALACAGCASFGAEERIGGDSPVAAAAWITTGDQQRLLDPAPVRRTASREAALITVDPAQRYQEMVGFGAALTDASAILMRDHLTDAARQALLRDLYGDGLGLGMLRLPIGASDFSVEHYTLDDVPPGREDRALTRFSMAPMRATGALPIVQEMRAINPELAIIASPWSAPAWMKTSGSLIGGRLRREAYPAFAEYLRRYAQAMADEGAPLFALTIQNEPHFEPANYPGMRMTPAERATFIGEHLGPLLERSHLPVRILEWDHNWDEWRAPMAVLADPRAAPYVDGVAWHCYAGEVAAQSQVHEAYPAAETYFTECSGGEWDPAFGDALLWNVNTLIIGATRNWARGVILWNLALDQDHGPHLGGCGDCRGVVTIDSRTGEVTRNVEYYALAHASRFVRRGARRIGSQVSDAALSAVAFRNSDDGSLVLIVTNAATAGREVALQSPQGDFALRLDARSVATVVWGGRRAAAAPSN
ncbi:MAG: hypothetical protein JNJ63_03095 [Hyphomonadaceae bacterium]|nr:hypothetical protein [Hyphomonadaceae bacterium]